MRTEQMYRIRRDLNRNWEKLEQVVAEHRDTEIWVAAKGTTMNSGLVVILVRLHSIPSP
jgi:hypothetical protein